MIPPSAIREAVSFALEALANNLDDGFDFLDGCQIRTAAQAGYLTDLEGLEVWIPDGSRFLITIQEVP